MEKSGAVIIEGHVQGLANTRIFGRNDIPVVVLDKTKYNLARYSKYCNKFYNCPEYLSNDFVDLLINLSEEVGLKDWLLFPSNDHAVYNIAKHREALEGSFKIITPQLEITERIYNKENLLKTASGVGVPIPPTEFTYDLELNDFGIGLPVITKGKKGLSFYKKTGQKAFVGENKKELRKNLQKISKTVPIDETFTQTIIPDHSSNTISFAAFCIDGKIKSYWVGKKIRQHPAKFGTATFCKSIQKEELLKLAKPLLKELNYTGICEIEFIKNPEDGEYKLIEINPRTWLWVELAVESGVNFPMMVYNYLNGVRMDYPDSYEVGLKWRNIITDIIYSYKNILTGHLDFANYKSSVRDNIIHAIKSKEDPEPYKRALLVNLVRLFQR